MMGVFKNLKDTLKSGWDNLTPLKRVGLISFLTIAISLGLIGTLLSQRINYSLLFSEIEEADSGKIVADLETQGIAYRLEDSGTTIYIDEKYVDKYRIELAVNDMLPRSSMGFEIFDDTSMMATDEDREIMQQRAIQGELERAIGVLDGVSSVKVLLSLPEKNVFTRPEDMKTTTASIVVTTDRSRDLSSAAIQGIAALVSGAVDHLPLENVSIVDQTGRLLSGFIQSGTNLQSADLASQNRQIENEYAQELERKLLETLAPVYGPENLSVSVNVKMNFDVAEEEIVNYGVDQAGKKTEPYMRSQDITASGGEISSGDNALNGNNVAINEVLEGEGGNTASYDSTTNYEYDTTKIKRIVETGEVEKISASILYNAGTADVKELDVIARNILGATERDSIQITATKFLVADLPAEPAPELDGVIGSVWKGYKTWIFAGSGFLLLTVLLIVLLLSRKRRSDLEDNFEEEIPSKQTHHSEKADLETLQDLLKDEKLEKEKNAYQQAKENPDLVADMIKMWLKDE